MSARTDLGGFKHLPARHSTVTQLRKLENDIERTKEITGPDHHSVASAETLVGKD